MGAVTTELIAENGGRHELRLEPSVARPQIYSCIGSRHWAGMVLEKRAVQIAIDWRSGRNPSVLQVGASIYADPCTELVFSARPRALKASSR